MSYRSGEFGHRLGVRSITFLPLNLDFLLPSPGNEWLLPTKGIPFGLYW